ncbi:hypothetical protein [Enterococcus sp. DIV2324]|uniref:hypothetical protein n=1 Tax=Enterococcus sp. DIV2324 TaxID=2774763 RepID=UPI003F206925
MNLTANNEQLKNDLRTWEEEHRGHTGLFDADLMQIEEFTQDPMFKGLTVFEKETIKLNLVHFLTQVV